MVKNPPASAGDAGLIPESGKSPGDGNGNPLQYSCLENPVDRGTWWTTVHGVAKSWTPLSEFTLTFTYAFLLGRKVMTNLDKACSKAETLLCQERSF